jgi:hypothetical protein
MGKFCLIRRRWMQRETYTQKQLWSYTHWDEEHSGTSGTSVWNSGREGTQKRMIDHQQNFYCNIWSYRKQECVMKVLKKWGCGDKGVRENNGRRWTDQSKAYPQREYMELHFGT